MKPLLLIIDDDINFTNDLISLLEEKYNCISAANRFKGLEILKKNDPDVVLLDLMLGRGESGLDILDEIKKQNSMLPVIMITDYGSVTTAIEAIKRGAFDYVSKTPNVAELELIIEKSLTRNKEKIREKELLQELQKPYVTMIGNSVVMKGLKEKIKLYSAHLNSIIITGESGVGKELVARQIHLLSPRANKPFVGINCAAIPRDLLESELFGYEKGAFTGASSRKLGKFEIASDGVLFLDEISELDMDAQVKLLRILQEKEFERLGGNQVIQTDVKIITATNKDLKSLVEEGKFREDLYYRLDVLPIHVPPLRERREDIPELMEHFLAEALLEMKSAAKHFSEEAIQVCLNYNWPGNIRQLKNYVTRAAILSGDGLINSHLLDIPGEKEEGAESGKKYKGKVPESWVEMNEIRKEEEAKAGRWVEKRFIEYILNKYDGNISRAAENIGINRANLHKMIKRCGL